MEDLYRFASPDIALGIGGLPKGRIELDGPESSGQTTLALHAMAEAQKAGGTAAFVDAGTCAPRSMPKAGVDLDELIVSPSRHRRTGAGNRRHAGALQRHRRLVVDSVAALVPRRNRRRDGRQYLSGLQARLMSQALRKITASISPPSAMVIFINQIRMKIGVMYGNQRPPRAAMR